MCLAVGGALGALAARTGMSPRSPADELQEEPEGGGKGGDDEHSGASAKMTRAPLSRGSSMNLEGG